MGGVVRMSRGSVDVKALNIHRHRDVNVYGHFHFVSIDCDSITAYTTKFLPLSFNFVFVFVFFVPFFFKVLKKLVFPLAPQNTFLNGF